MRKNWFRAVLMAVAVCCFTACDEDENSINQNGNNGQDGDSVGNIEYVGKYIAVVDVSTFTKTKDIEVVLNPYNQILTGADNKVYFVSNGNYAGSDWLEEKDYIYQTLQCIDPVTDEVTSLCNATYIANSDDKMYILYSEYYLPQTKRAFVFNLRTKEESDFIDINSLPNPQFIATDPSTGNIYIGNTYYDGSFNDIYVYNENGEKINELEAGYYTTNMRFMESSGAYIINTGDWNANNGSIMWYDKANNTVSPDLYMTANGKGIGDVQDLCVYGSKMYVTSTTSSKLVILDLQGKELKSISLADENSQPISPRYITPANGHVYFTAYDGTVSRVDTTTMEITGKLNVGKYPEGLTYANGKLYVCLSNQ